MDLKTIAARHYQNPELPGCSILVKRNGETLLADSFGVTDLESKTPITPATNFRLASVTKQFTAASILRLVDRGQLRLNTPIAEVLPGLPPWGATIEIRHLLGHTSGLPDYEALISADATIPPKDAEVLAMTKAQPTLLSEPGSKYHYSNSGYAVLAMVVEAVSGRRFAEFLDGEFFKPLGMNHSVAFEKGVSEVPNRAYGHRFDKDAVCRFADQSISSSVLGDGGIYTSILDYEKWAEGWFAGKIVSLDSQRLAWTNGQLNDGTITEYGLGWRVTERQGLKIVHHTGSTTGFNTYARLVPEKRIIMLVLSNRNGGQPKAIVQELEDFLFQSE